MLTLLLSLLAAVVYTQPAGMMYELHWNGVDKKAENYYEDSPYITNGDNPISFTQVSDLAQLAKSHKVSSPGHRPGCSDLGTKRPERAKAYGI